MNSVKNLIFVQIENFANFTFRCFGFFPIFVGTKKASKLSEFLLKCWSGVMLLLASININTAIRNKDKFFNNSSLANVNDVLKFSCSTVAVFVAIIESVTSAEKFRKVFKHLESFDAECKTLKINFGCYKAEIARSFGLKFIFFMLLIILTEIYIFHAIDWKGFWLAAIFQACACRVRHLQHIHFLHQIRSKVSILRDEITKIVAYSQRISLSSDKLAYEMIWDRLQTLKTSYGILWRAAFTVNECFTWSLTANLVQNFIQMGCDSYNMYIAVSRYPEEGEYNWILLACMLITPMTLIFAILHEAEGIKNDSSKIPIELHRIRKNRNDVELHKMVRDSLTNERIERLMSSCLQIIHFSLQTIHEKISMRAKSLFDINNRLFISILSGITTYLVCIEIRA